MAVARTISDRDVLDAALVFAASHITFTTSEFTAFLHMQAPEMDEDQVNDILVGMVESRQLREIGPAVYSRTVCHS